MADGQLAEGRGLRRANQIKSDLAKIDAGELSAEETTQLADMSIPFEDLPAVMDALLTTWKNTHSMETRRYIVKLATNHTTSVTKLPFLFYSLNHETLRWCRVHARDHAHAAEPPNGFGEIQELIMQLAAKTFHAQRKKSWFEPGEDIEVYNPDTMTFEEAQYYEASDNKTTSFVRYYQKHREGEHEDKLLIETVKDENIASVQKPVAVKFEKNEKVDVMLRGTHAGKAGRYTNSGQAGGTKNRQGD